MSNSQLSFSGPSLRAGLVACMFFFHPSVLPSDPVKFIQAPLKLEVRQAIALALKQGPNMVGGNLDRESQRILNEAAARIFYPNASFVSDYNRNTSQSNFDRSTSKNTSFGIRSSVKAITGAELSAGLTRNDSASIGSSQSLASLELTQPLLRGGGLKIGSLDKRSIELSEESSILGFEAVRRATVADTFGAYYTLYESRESLAIAQRALARARESASINDLLVQTGRLARIDLLQTQADVARAELQVEQAERSDRDAQRRLALLLGLPAQTTFDLPELKGEPPKLSMQTDEAVKLALAQRIEVRSAENSIQSQRINLVRAKDNLLPRLDLIVRTESSIGSLVNDGTLVDPQRPRSNQAGLNLDIQLSRSEVRAAYSAAVIDLQRSEVALNDLRSSIETETINAIEGFNSAQRSLAMAQATLDLQQGRLKAENEKLKVGRASISQLSDAQESVRSAERDALSSRLDLVRKSFDIDQAIGLSVEIWSRPGQ